MPSNKDMVTRVDADIDPLRKALSDAGVYVDKFATRVDTSLSKVSNKFADFGKDFIASGLAAATAAFTAAITTSLSSLGDLADKADRIGVLTDEMQVLRYAGITVGSAIDETDGAITKFVKNVGEAQQETGGLYDITKQYGIALTDVNGKARSAIDVLGDVADVVRDAETAQERLRIVTEAFGKDAIALVPVLEKGKEGLAGMAEEALELGVVIDKETIEKADAFTDAWDKAAYITGVRLKAAFVDAFLTIDQLIQNSQKRAQLYGRTLVQIVQNSYRGAPTPAKGGQFTPVDPSLGLSRSRSDLENFAAGNYTGGLEGFGGQMNRRMGNLEYSPSPFPEPKKGTKDKLSEEQKAAQKELNKLLEMQNTLKDAGIDLDKASLEQLNTVLETTQAQSQAQQMIKTALEDQAFAATDLGKRLKEQLDEIGDTGREVGRDIGLTFSSAFEEAIADGGDLKSVLQGLLGDISKIVARKMVTEPLGDFLGDVFANVKFANGGIMSSSGPVPLRAYSSGGIANSPQLALYGEGSMNEAYVPLPDGRRIPVNLKGGRGGGGNNVSVQQNFTIDARGADPSVLPNLQRMFEQNKRETLQAVAAQVKRGGTYAKTMGKR